MTAIALRSRRLPRPPKKLRGNRPVRCNYHLPAELVREIDAYGAKMAAQDPLGRGVTRGDAIRALLRKALGITDDK